MSLRSLAQRIFPNWTIAPPPSSLLTEFFSGLEVLNEKSSDQQLAEIRQFSARFYMGEEKLEGLELQKACKALVEWHIEKLNTAPFSSAQYILVSLNRTMSNIGCHPVRDENDGPHSNQKENLRRILVARTIEEINKSDSGCVVDMHLKSFMHAMDQIGLKMGDDVRLLLIKTSEAKARQNYTDRSQSVASRTLWMEWEDAFDKLLIPSRQQAPSAAPSFAQHFI